MKKALGLAIVLLLVLAGCGGTPATSGSTASDSTTGTGVVVPADEDYFEWDGNIITALTDEGAAQESITIPSNCEGFSDFVFSVKENKVKSVSFAQAPTCDVKDMLSFSALEQVILPAQMTEVVDNMFSFCSNLGSIEIPAGVTRVGQFAFSDNTSLSKVTFLGDAVTKIDQYAFRGCTSLGEVNLPANLAEVGDSAFAGCTSMNSLTLPSSLKTVGLLAFADCGLEDLYVPEDLQFDTVADTSFYQVGRVLRVHVVEGSWMDLNFDNVFLDDNYYEKVYG